MMWHFDKLISQVFTLGTAHFVVRFVSDTGATLDRTLSSDTPSLRWLRETIRRFEQQFTEASMVVEDVASNGLDLSVIDPPPDLDPDAVAAHTAELDLRALGMMDQAVKLKLVPADNAKYLAAVEAAKATVTIDVLAVRSGTLGR